MAYIAIVAGLSGDGVSRNGAPEEIRTPDPQIRSLVLYPAELRARFSQSLSGPGGRRCRMHSEIISEVAKARHSYRLRTGLARCAQALSGSRFTLKLAS
jgi:hypothetical protein